MATPVTAFLAWYESLPKPQRQSLALFAAGFNPGLEEVEAAGLDDTIAAFTRLVTGCETDKLRAIGLMVSLRGSFEYLFSRDWEARRRSWEETERENFARSERERSSEEEELVRGCVLEIDSRHAQERATIEKWRQLVATDLSDDSLEAWWLVQSPDLIVTPLQSGFGYESIRESDRRLRGELGPPITDAELDRIVQRGIRETRPKRQWWRLW